MPLDEEFLHDRLELRARRARNRGAVVKDGSPVRDMYEGRDPRANAEVIDQTNWSIIGLGVIAGMTT